MFSGGSGEYRAYTPDMEIAGAWRMIVAEAVGPPQVRDMVAGGRGVPRGMSRMAAREGVSPTLRGAGAVDDMVTTLAREIDRRAPVVWG